MSEEEHKKTIDDQLSKYSFLPTLSDAKKYWTMAIIDGSAEPNAMLNKKFNPETSLYNDQILFVFYKQIPKLITTQLLQFASDEHKQFLPENVCIVKEEEYWYISLMIGAFLTRSFTKVLVFGGDDLANKFGCFSEIFQKHSRNKRLEFREMMMLKKTQERYFFVSLSDILTPENNEIDIMRQAIMKIHEKLQNAQHEIPKEILKFAKSTLNLIKGILQKKKIEASKQQIEKITMMVIYEFFASGYFINEYYFYKLMNGQTKTLQELQKNQEIKFFEYLVSTSSMNMGIGNLEESKIQKQGSSQQLESQKDIKSPQNNVQIIDQQQNQQLPQQQNKQIPVQQNQKQLEQHNPKQAEYYGIPQEFQILFSLLVFDTNKTTLKSFKRANIQQIRKIKNLISSLQNYFKNEIISRQKLKTTFIENEKQLLEEILANEQLQQLAVLNILCFFKKYGLMVIENNQYSFNGGLIENLMQIEFKIVTQSFEDVEQFKKNPLQFLQSFQGEPSLLQQQFNNKPQDQMQYATAQIPYQPYMIPMHMQGQPQYYYQAPPGYSYVIPQQLPPGQIPQNVGMPPVYQMPAYGSFPQQQYIPQMQVMAYPPYQQYPISQQQMMAAPGYQAPPMMIPQEIQKDQQNQQQLNQVQKKRI